MKMKACHLLTLLVLTWVRTLPVQADAITTQREGFLKAQKYITDNNEAGFLSVMPGLRNYPLYPYLRYQWLKTRLTNTGEVTGFLSEFKVTRYAPLLKAKWLDFLAVNERWGEFYVNYETNDKTGEDCRYYWAQHQSGKPGQALTEAKRLWLSGKEAKGECKRLFDALQKSSPPSAENNWQRFETALTQKHAEVARSVMPLLSGQYRQDAEAWLTLNDHPQAIDDAKFWQNKTARTGRLFAHAIKRLLTFDKERSLLTWDTKKLLFPIDQATADEVELRFAKALLGDKDPRAYEHFAKLSAIQEADIRFAKVRAALVEQNWQHVAAAIAGLTDVEKQQPQWQYWQARALAQTSQGKEADEIYKALAKDRSYYGFLAADIVKANYQFADHPVIVAEADLKTLAEIPEFKACQEFIAVDLPVEARRQWHFAIKNLTKEKLQVAAKLAQQWQWPQIAITTMVKADFWDDLALRFPLQYQDIVRLNAEQKQLDAALIYGVMRQESMLDKEAVSGAGARGLMQLMPETAKTVANALQEPWMSPDMLFNPEVNIRYGSHYFKSLLEKFSGHAAIAGAAYNAGPHKAVKWLPAMLPVPADVWVDTIPYQETRKYVTSVLSYAIIYQYRLQGNKFKLKDLLPDVRPGINLS